MDIILPLAKMLRNGEISSFELTKKYIEAIEKKNGIYNAFVSATFEKAIEYAKSADTRIKNKEGSLLCGIPVALKDNICSDGDLTTCASKMLENYRACYDATAWAKLKAHGAVLLGKTNMDEFAMGSTSEKSIYGATKNPKNTNYVAGGSSGGSACAVASGLCAYALGSDTGGSVRQPASFCGIVGLKPTYGTVSRYGLVSYASSFDQIGILASSAADASVVFDAISGKDERDMTSADFRFNPSDAIESSNIKGLKIGIAEEFFEKADGEIKNAVLNACGFFEKEGAELVEISLPDLNQLLSVYYIIACAEASSNLGRYDGIRYGHRAKNYSTAEELITESRTEGFGDEVKRRILLGTYVLSSGYYDEYYKKACLLREKLKTDFDGIFRKCDIILTPTAPTTAIRLGRNTSSPTELYFSDILTVPVNIAGLPALSIPAGNDSKGLPIGIQLIGNRFSEALLLRVAQYFEKGFDTGQSEITGGVPLV